MPADASVAASTAAHAADVRWREHNTARRQQILNAAVSLLDRSSAGDEITMGDVAREAGLAKSVVYRQFSGRDELFARMRTHITEQYFADVVVQIDLSKGSSIEVLTRTISAIAVFMQSHPRWVELARRGPRHDDPIDVDAMSSIRQRLASRAAEILERTAASTGIDPAVFRQLPAAVATMHSGVLQDWLAEPQPTRSLDEVVSELSRFTWHLLDGAAREAGLELDPHLEISALLTQLTAAAACSRESEPLRSRSRRF